MLQLEPPNYQHCPFCGQKLAVKIEENKRRKYCQSCNWHYYPHVPSAAGAIIVRDNQVLLVQRSRKPYKGKWMFPSGFVDYGENPKESVAREVEEETGLKVTGVEFYKLCQVIDDPREPGHFYFSYKVKVSDGELKNDSEENQNIGWFDINNPPEIAWIDHRQIIRELQK